MVSKDMQGAVKEIRCQDWNTVSSAQPPNYSAITFQLL